jgi:hypothetical protein
MSYILIAVSRYPRQDLPDVISQKENCIWRRCLVKSEQVEELVVHATQ